MDTNIEKNQKYIVDIIDYGFEGEGIAKIENFTIFIPGAIKGEKIRIHIVKVLSSHAYGKIIEIIEKSKKRVLSDDCKTYVRCGGCNLRHIDYEETLNIKENVVKNLVNKSLSKNVEVLKTIGMGNPYNYRNKAQYPIGIDNNTGKPVIGVYARRSHDIIPMEKCAIQTELSEEIVKYLYEYIIKNNIEVYNEKTGTGILRHIVIRSGFRTDEIMCILVLNEKEIPNEKELVDILINKFPNIKTIIKNINRKNTNVILGNESITLCGEGYITDYLDEYIFNISPMSFYQINPIQTEVMYNKAIELANIDEKTDLVALDLYCGIGTIGIFISKYFKKVYGIEIVEQAIQDAKNNAKINDIDNIEFICGDVEDVLTELIEERKITPDVVFVDPPRKGLDNTTIDNIIKIKPKKVIYISCNPATLIRDLAKLEEVYNINVVQPIDMFPYTHHIESICLLDLKKG